MVITDQQLSEWKALCEGYADATASEAREMMPDVLRAARTAMPALIAEVERLREALEVRTWSEAERDGMADAFARAQDRGKGHYETLFAVAAFVLRHRREALS